MSVSNHLANRLSVALVDHPDVAELIGLLNQIGSGGAFVATNEFWIDTTVVDSPTSASLRMFSTIVLALADINGGSIPAGAPFVLRCREGQDHAWDGTGYLNDRSGTIYAQGGLAATTLDVSAGLTITGVDSFDLVIRNMTVSGGGVAGITATGGTYLQFVDCTLSELTGCEIVSADVRGDSTIDTCDFDIESGLFVQGGAVSACTFISTAGTGVYSATDVVHDDCFWLSDDGELTVRMNNGTVTNALISGETVFGQSGAPVLTNVLLTATGTTFALDVEYAEGVVPALGRGIVAVLNDVSIKAVTPDAFFLFSDPTPTSSSTVELNDVRFAYSGEGVVEYAENAVVTTNNGFVVLGAALATQPDGTFYADGANYIMAAPGVAGAPPAVVQAAATTDGAAGLTLDAAPTSGNLLVAMSFNPSVFAAGAGWTVQYTQGTGLDYGVVLTKVAGGAEPALQTPLFAAPGTGALMIWELSGQAATFFVAVNGQVEQVGPTVVGPALPNVASTIALIGMGSVDAVSSVYNVETDVLENGGTRKAFAGHSFAPGVAQLLGQVASTGGYKSAVCLITS